MTAALKSGQPQGFARRRSLGRAVQVPAGASTSQVQAAIDAAYRQLLNRVPLAAERLSDAESQLRDGQLTMAGFVAKVATSDLFTERLNRMAPLRAAAAASMALLGRAAQPVETSRFLATRVRSGLRTAIEDLLDSNEYGQSFGQDRVPFLKGMGTSDGIPLSTVNRTANLYSGNGGLTPKPKDAI
jgi:phycobilisome core-membrane linker protein